MLVIADSNEKATSPSTIRLLEQEFGKVSIANLKAGDLNIIHEDGSKLAIERKEVHDFLNSIGDGRLFRQVESMSENAKYYAIVIQGSIGFDKNDMVLANGELTKWSGASVRGALFSVNWSGCPTVFAPADSYGFICGELSNFVQKEDEHLQRSHRRIVTFPPIETCVDILCAFPNIGLTRAQSLIEFVGEKGEDGTLADALCWASAFPLIKSNSRPKGWGNKIVESFRKELGLKESEYLTVRTEEER